MNALDQILAAVVAEIDCESPAKRRIGSRLGINSVEIGLHSQRTRRRQFADLSGQTVEAARVISRLPTPGETLHFILDGSFVLASVIPVIVAHINEPCRLTACTLGLNDSTTDLLAIMLKDGRLASLRLAMSSYFKSADAQTADRAVKVLKAQGAEVAVERVHCKLQLYEPTKSKNRFVLLSSSNLRSANCIEAGSLSNDGGLYTFFDKWLTTFFDKHRI